MNAPVAVPAIAQAVADHLTEVTRPIWSRDRLATDIKRLLDEHGTDNVLETIACVFDDMAMDHTGDAARDWAFAAKVIRAANLGCDLAFGDRAADGTPAFTLRTRARDTLIDLATSLRS